ncbi:MAG TPA: hypothetical protein VGK49_11780 [Ilumatobacteraceae bacterium]
MIEQLRQGLVVDVTADGIARALTDVDGDIAADDLARVSEVLAEFIQRVPDAIGEALAMSKDPRCGRAIAFAVGSILTYVFDPDDLLSESGHGDLGLLDDAYLVHTFVGQLAAMYPFASTGSHEPPGLEVMRAVAAILPDGIAPSLARTCDTILHVAQALFVAGADGGGAAVPEVELQLRVAEAVHAMNDPESVS